MCLTRTVWLGLLASCVAMSVLSTPAAAQQRPNIIVIVGDDIGWMNIGAYHQGLMYSTTPNLDKMAAEGMRFTDYYAEPSCTAGRANFITGELPIRTGLTTIGQAGASVGIPDEAPTIATALKAMGYATAQFGKNHLGDLNRYLPTVHGFYEFFGYLYHLDAMEDPFWHSYPPALRDQVGPRNLIHSFATTADDQTVQPRWGRIGRQTIEDEGPLPPHPMPGIKHNMETIDEDILDYSVKFIDKVKQENKPFFLWVNPTRAHIISHLSPKYQAKMTGDNQWYLEEAVMAQLDDVVGGLLAKLKARQHDHRVHDRQRHRELHLARRRQHAVQRRQGNDHGGRHARADDRPLAGPHSGQQGREWHNVGSRLFPDVPCRGRQPEHRGRVAQGQGDRRSDLQGSPRRLQPARHADRPRAFQAP